MVRKGRLIGAALAAATAAAGLWSVEAGTGTAAALPVFHRPVAVVAANQSNNWSGYNQGTLERTGTLFSSIAGSWTVPSVSQHTAGQAEYSSTWVGIGGGCVDAGCTLTDSTLIQAGTEQDVSASGAPSYYAWWEIIPEPETRVTLPVAAGNHISVTIAQTTPGMWAITILNQTTGRRFTKSTPYPSTRLTAEWIEETPLIIGTGGGFAPLPNLSTVHMDLAKVNGTAAGLAPAEQMQLVDGSGHVIAQPSNPDPDRDGFNDCAWATTCAAPRAS